MRRRRPEKREILPDPVYGDLIVAKFINNLMKQGKKSLAEKIFYQSIEKIKKQGKVDDGIELFKKALENVAPVLEVKSKRIGGATYQVPIEISEGRRMALAMRWIIGYSKSRKGQTMADRLAAELLAAANNDGSAVKKKEDTHRMAEANKAFSHFR
ncbi:MAG TPA: 30S ribosomal protein S7 [Candidatus Marinimicrobia bacterium]|jgi:small subunit ribosomal protein S7|uniref:Small ribosomal subunit protein uS7 domain-containing protein n=1 Tax=marine metagenome TaxID=408172 RepID=A0A381RMA4_9ZZZZ|nr:30S ribosomal protein S7 [Candidatus Neomarinimicrobiota bacterium]HJM84136.1 30S ribosomal protein S7 [Candidatus Neomarinimicrobiota bacterium]|tara:strand:- start:195 stop:662 length:468 start_codon:yes stop_codon:yes gene_type:complete